MRLIDADELMEHVWRDKLDSRELIAEMIENAPTVKTTDGWQEMTKEELALKILFKKRGRQITWNEE